MVSDWAYASPSSNSPNWISFLITKSKRAQMKIQQTAFMLLAITLFFVLIGLFILVFRFSSLRESATLLEEKNALLLVEKLANSPEFSCGDVFRSQRISCIDLDKALALRKNIDKYSGFWGVSNIEIIKIYPEVEEIPIYSSGTTGYTVSNFVAICSKDFSGENIKDKCELAKLVVGYESRG